MNKYFRTLDQATLFHVEPYMSEAQTMRVLKKALNKEHQAGPEAKHIIKIWREQENEQR
jgi:hypothetical protein